MSVDVDADSLAIAKDNIAQVEMDEFITLRHEELVPPGAGPKDRLNPSLPAFKTDEQFDTVIMNPPFGSWRKGIDMVFLEIAFAVCVYTRSHCDMLTVCVVLSVYRRICLLVAQTVHTRFHFAQS